MEDFVFFLELLKRNHNNEKACFNLRYFGQVFIQKITLLSFGVSFCKFKDVLNDNSLFHLLNFIMHEIKGKYFRNFGNHRSKF